MTHLPSSLTNALLVIYVATALAGPGFLGLLRLLDRPRDVDARSSQSAADLALLVTAWCAPLLGLAAKLTSIGFGIVLLGLVSPVIIGVLAYGLWMFHTILGTRSRVRARYGTVPRHYRVSAGLWALSVFLPGLVFPEFGFEGGDDTEWFPVSAAERLIGAPVPGILVLVVLAACSVAVVALPAFAHAARNRDVPRPPQSLRPPATSLPRAAGTTS